MKNIALLLGSCALLTACETDNSKWQNDCNATSISAREFKACMARVEEGRNLDGSRGVALSPANTKIVGESDNTKDRGGYNDTGDQSN